MFKITDIENKIINGDTLEVLKKIPSESIDMCITSPPYYGLRDYENEKQIGQEDDFNIYLDKLLEIYRQVYRVLKKKGSCWVNIADVYSKGRNQNVRKQSLIGIPDRFKIKMIDDGWICRNEIIWHKPNAMPSSAKTRFNNDYEKMFFFVKDDLYHFETQYEEAKTSKVKNSKIDNSGKYKDDMHEKSVRQGMSKTRGQKLIEVRPILPSQKDFVDFIRDRTTLKMLSENVDSIKKTTMEHWFRYDEKGFSYPSVKDWNIVKYLIDDFSEKFNNIDKQMNYVIYETDDINKNIHKGRIKRAVWSVNTKPFKGGHFAPYPKELIEKPIISCCPIGGIVLDIFIGSGTTGIVALENNRKYIGIELNEQYIEVANNRINESVSVK